jgi:ABC-type Fe3+ transport system, periplasmic component
VKPAVPAAAIVWACSLALAACRSDSRTPVVVYSPHGRDQLVLMEHDFERLHPEIDVRWLDMGSQEILDRVRFEKVNPQADVWFGGPTTIFDRASPTRCSRPTAPTGRVTSTRGASAPPTSTTRSIAPRRSSPTTARSSPPPMRRATGTMSSTPNGVTGS